MGLDPRSPGSHPRLQAALNHCTAGAPNKLDFKPKTVRRDEKEHYIILTGSIQQEDLTIVNIYAPNLEAANYINQLITKVKKHM